MFGEARGAWLLGAAVARRAALVGSAPTHRRGPNPSRRPAAEAGGVAVLSAVVAEEDVDGDPLDEVFAAAGEDDEAGAEVPSLGGIAHVLGREAVTTGAPGGGRAASARQTHWAYGIPER